MEPCMKLKKMKILTNTKKLINYKQVISYESENTGTNESYNE